MMHSSAIDEARLEELMARAVFDLSAAISAPLMRLGDRLGLYRVMAYRGPMTSFEVAERAGCDERMVREWLANQVAGGWVFRYPDSDEYELPDEHALALADEDSPFFVLGAFDILAALWADEDRLIEAFRSGRGLPWHAHDQRLFRGTERFFGPAYRAHLVSTWIPSLTGVEEKLRQGAHVADVGCGHGASTLILAQAYPESRFAGFDYHEPSIHRARALAARAEVADRVSFEVAKADEFRGRGFDLVCSFDCLSEIGDPVAAARHAAEAMDPDGSYMVVEPYAGHALEDNMNPLGRLFYAASAMISTPAAKAQEGDIALGAQAGERRLIDVLNAGGFARVRLATESPFNLVLEARL
jgi:SAM-dependent methyltransferase